MDLGDNRGGPSLGREVEGDRKGGWKGTRGPSASVSSLSSTTERDGGLTAYEKSVEKTGVDPSGSKDSLGSEGPPENGRGEAEGDRIRRR